MNFPRARKDAFLLSLATSLLLWGGFFFSLGGVRFVEDFGFQFWLGYSGDDFWNIIKVLKNVLE